MDNLTQQQLEDMWALYLENADAETCFAIDKQYKLMFGYWALKDWMERRRKQPIADETLIIPTQITLNCVKQTFTMAKKKPKDWSNETEHPK